MTPEERGPDDLILPRVFLRPAPWLVGTFPERSERRRVMGARMVLVGLAANDPRIATSLRRCAQAPTVRDALVNYAAWADKAIEALGLGHRRELLARDEGPMPTRYDLDQILALAEIAPTCLPLFAIAASALHVALERSRPLVSKSLAESVHMIPALAPMSAWLVPALVRWLHVRWWESLYDPAPSDESMPARQRRAEAEASAVLRDTPTPRRHPFDRAWKHESEDAGFTQAYLVKAWWAVRVGHPDDDAGQQTQRDVARRWHARMTTGAHKARAEAKGLDVTDCGCWTVVRRGLAQIERDLAGSA